MYSFFFTLRRNIQVYTDKLTQAININKDKKTEKYIILIYFYTYQHLIMPCIPTKVDYCS